MEEAIFKGGQLWNKIQQGDLKAFTFSDIIWLAGFILLIFAAAKVGYKLLKVFFIIAIIAFIIGFLFFKGILPIT